MMRFGPGPVFVYECLANSRRWQTYALRSIGVAVLLAAITSIAVPRVSWTINPSNAWREYAALGESYFYAIIGVELTLVLLAAPAATAGAICVDRARGTLAHMMVTDLSDSEIVLGKLAARLLPVFGLVACSWPVMALSSLLGGLDPAAVTWAFAIILAVSVLGCTMAMAMSVWARKSHEVVLAVYGVWAIVMLIWPIWDANSRSGNITIPAPFWCLVADPYVLAFAPYAMPGRMGGVHYCGFFAATLGLSGLLAMLTMWRMRPVACRGTVEKPPRHVGLGVIGRLWRALPSPSIDGNPVLWREWHRSRPSRWMMILLVVFGGGTSVACAYAAAAIWAYGLDDPRGGIGMGAGITGVMIQWIFGLMVLSATAPMSMSEERQRGSLDLLSATTLSTPTIVLGKWLAMLRPAALLAIGPGLLGLALATTPKSPPPIPPGAMPQYYELMARGELLFVAALLVATIVIHGALIASMGLAAAVWIARQGRAVAACVGTVVIIAAGWPVFFEVIRMGPMAESVGCLSPVVAAIILLRALDMRTIHYRGMLRWVSFWELECLVLALGLLWLVVRSFDERFERIPDRPRRTSLLSDIVIVLAALIGFGGVYGSGATWILGIKGVLPGVELGGFFCGLLAAVGLVLTSALSASIFSRMADGDRRTFAARWWEAFRLVVLLAIGPALVVLSLATTPLPPRVNTTFKPAPGGGTIQISTTDNGDTYVWTRDGQGVFKNIREATAAEIAEAGIAPPMRTDAERLGLAAVSVFSFLAHGAAFVSLGAALGVWIRRRRWAIAASVLLVVAATMAWPLLYAWIDYPRYEWVGLITASVIAAYMVLLIPMFRFALGLELNGWVGYWDLLWLLGGIIVAGLAVRAMECRRRSEDFESVDALRRSHVQEVVGSGS